MAHDVISQYNAFVFWLLLLTTLWLLFTLVSKRRTLTRQRRNILTVWAGAQTLVMVVMLALYIFAFWPALPSIASQREPDAAVWLNRSSYSAFSPICNSRGSSTDTAM